MKRRQFLKSSAIAGLGAVTATGVATAQINRTLLPDTPVRNIIFFVYDGFSWEDFAVARHFAQRHQNRTLALERLFSLGITGSQMTHSLTSLVTDSAAAATAWSTGCRTANTNLAVYPDGRHLTTILELAKSSGMATGLITTTRVTHATPAGFTIHKLDRNREDEIAEQYLELQPDVILGGGSRHFDPQLRRDGKDLFAQYSSHGYSIARSRDDLARLSSSKVLGTFTPSHLPYEIDRINQEAGGPSLAEITRKGLNLLSDAPRGFIAQVEAGRIDHANHNNDPATMMWDVLAADEALEIVLNFTDRNPETLLILASDHGTGGGAIYGTGKNYHKTSETFDRISRRKSSYEYLLELLGPAPQPTEIIDAASEYLGAALTLTEAQSIIEAMQGNPKISHTIAYHEQPSNSLAWFIADGKNFENPEQLNIHYTAGQHTAGPVPIALYSANTSPVQLGLVDITDVFYWMTQAIGSDHRNPVMSEKEAWSILQEA